MKTSGSVNVEHMKAEDQSQLDRASSLVLALSLPLVEVSVFCAITYRRVPCW
ncbi:hypothetical protein BV20DRAFT_971824 [Pilatotrama ljubarskyi]|nr:hypothetical protein BV20DRAFT_971824 [Pilatotrama ljubarskyi]